MVVFEGEPTTPKILFWSGDECFYLRGRTESIDGVPHTAICMIPTEHVRFRYPEIVNEKTISYDITELGTIVKVYPGEFIVPLSMDNPEAPWLLGLCNFDGSYTLDMEIKRLKRRIQEFQSEIDSLNTENHNLRVKLKDARSFVKELG